MKKDFFYNSNDGITTIHGIKWDIDNPRAVIQIAHGVTEYIDRYDEFANFLNSKGFVVVGNDHIGHGLSTNSKKMYFGPKNSFDYVIDDVLECTNIIKNK